MKINLAKQFVNHLGGGVFVRVVKKDDTGNILFQQNAKGEEITDGDGNPIPQFNQIPDMIQDAISAILFSSKKEGKDEQYDAVKQFNLQTKIAVSNGTLEVSAEDIILLKDVIKKSGNSVGIEAQMLLALEPVVEPPVEVVEEAKTETETPAEPVA